MQILEGLAESLKQGLSRSAALGGAAISSGTWRNWRRWQQAGRPRLANRGRPPRCATASERQIAIGFLVEKGGQVPLHAVRQHVPTVPRAELADLRSRYQRVACWRRDRHRGRLLWKRVGTVWSMDFTEPREYIGGTDRWILAIRDLASGYQLAWLSFAQATAECVVQVLKELFLEHGPPLVLKSDNGSQFIAEVTLSLLAQWQVEPLFNPPRQPAYNGGLERTHPILKGYTEAAAAAQGRPAGIRPEDLHTGRTNANRFTRRLGDDGPTAEAAWQGASRSRTTCVLPFGRRSRPIGLWRVRRGACRRTRCSIVISGPRSTAMRFGTLCWRTTYWRSCRTAAAAYGLAAGR